MNKMTRLSRQSIAASLLWFGAIATPMADVQYFTIDSSNATTGVMSLSQDHINDFALTNPTSLSVGGNTFDFATVYFVPTNTASYTFGQSSAPVDTVMILYNGVFDAANPGNLALVGNDDTGLADHQSVLGGTATVSCGGRSTWCPQVTYNVVTGQRYTLLISTWSPDATLSLPLSFYSDGAGNFYSVAGPTAADTLSSMTPNAYALRGVFIQQSAVINNGLSYDCTTFDAKGICLSTGGRVTDANNPSSNSKGALLIASYRANDHWRIGGHLDQNLSSNDPNGVNFRNNNPMVGAFAVWNQNTEGTGYQLRVATGYNDKDITISRTATGSAEAGQGNSSLQSQAYSATLSRGIQINDSRWIVSPYLGFVIPRLSVLATQKAAQQT